MPERRTDTNDSFRDELPSFVSAHRVKHVEFSLLKTFIYDMVEPFLCAGKVIFFAQYIFFNYSSLLIIYILHPDQHSVLLIPIAFSRIQKTLPIPSLPPACGRLRSLGIKCLDEVWMEFQTSSVLKAATTPDMDITRYR